MRSSDALIEQYTPLVKKVVRQLGFYQPKHFHQGMEVDDAIQMGLIAVWKASQDFDSEKMGVKLHNPFLVYAATRIRQEILDEMFRCRWVTGAEWKQFRISGMEDAYSDTNIEKEAETSEFLEKIGKCIAKFTPDKRNMYQGVMRHDGNGKRGNGRQYCETWGMGDSTLSYHRSEIRKRLRELH